MADFKQLVSLLASVQEPGDDALNDAIPGSEETAAESKTRSMLAQLTANKKTIRSTTAHSPSKAGSNDIWDTAEIEETAVDLSDLRKEPEYTIKYRQKLSSEDLYLQIDGKTPSIAHTDELVVTVQLPGAQFKDIVIDCTEDLLDVRCPQYKLIVSLPRKIHKDDGHAKWDAERQQLVVSAPVKAEYPFQKAG